MSDAPGMSGQSIGRVKVITLHKIPDANQSTDSVKPSLL